MKGHMEAEKFLRWWSSNANGAALRPLAVRFVSVSSFRLPSLPSRLLLLCLYKRGRSSPERHIRRFSSSRQTVPNSALLLSSSSRLAACTVRRDSRPPRPHLLSPLREKGDKVASSRTIRSPTTTSPTTTSSPTSTTSSTTWQARTPTPSPALLLLLCRTCSSPFC